MVAVQTVLTHDIVGLAPLNVHIFIFTDVMKVKYE